MHISDDDIIYVVLLLLGIGFGHFYRRIRDVDLKQAVGTAFGIAIIIFTSGINSLHIFITFLICSVIILKYKS